MLHLKFALNLENLAKELIDELSKAWTDPFKAPVVIFPDPKLEQWFRLRWIKEKGALANLNATTIERFLFDVLKKEGDYCKQLTADVLSNVIIAYLDQDGNWKKLDDEVTRYLKSDGDDADENRLFDFAQKMAALFLEYERSRPSDFAERTSGFLDCWQQGSMKSFFKDSAPAGKETEVEKREKWQQKLYDAIFHERDGAPSLLNRVFDEEAKRNGIPMRYDTIPFLYNKNGFDPEKLGKIAHVPVFVFGLSGLGQFYRVILHDFAQRHDGGVSVYVQNPCMEFWEDATRREWDRNTEPHGLRNFKLSSDAVDVDDMPETGMGNEENDLLVNWGRSGRDNIKLWCAATGYNYDFVFDPSNDAQTDTLLGKVKESIAQRKSLVDLDEGKLRGDDSLDVTAAPTKIREIENLHSRICRLLQKKKVKVEDILVVAPNLDDYRTAIEMVFDQTPKMPSKTDASAEKGFLHVPFAIIDSPAKASLTEAALEHLFSILELLEQKGNSPERKGVSRPDFFGLVRNPVVQASRGISNAEVDAWQEWVSETNTYRKRGSTEGGDWTKDDWEKLRRRLLLSQLTDDIVDPGQKCELKPYHDLASSDKSSLSRFAACVEDLAKWIAFCKEPISDLAKLSRLLDQWIGMRRVPDEMKSETIVRKRVLEALDRLHLQLEAGLPGVPTKIAKQCLLSGAQGTEYGCGGPFVHGVTFMKFAPNRTMPVKHLFFIGANADVFPGSSGRDSLDLRKSCVPWPGDESPISKNRYAFLCQLMSASEGFHLSYVNRDLKKDAELYPSSVVDDLRKFIEAAKLTSETPDREKKATWEEKTINLDETRPYADLFTPKSIRNKRICDAGSNKAANDPPQRSYEKKNAPPERVRAHELAKFLKDPFQFQVGMLLRKEDDENIEEEDFEPISLNHLDGSIVLKRMVVAQLSGNPEAIDELKKEYRLNGKTPDGGFGEKQWSHLENKCDRILEQMAKTMGMTDETGTPYKELLVEEFRKWSYGETIPDLSLGEWSLSTALDWCDAPKDKLDSATTLVEVSSAKNVDTEKFISPYIKALALIAAKGEDVENMQAISIEIYACNEAKRSKVSLSPKEAAKKLKEIYECAFVEKYGKCVPYGLKLHDDSTIFELREKLKGRHGKWIFFDKKNLFDPVTDVGFGANEFREDWADATKKMADLIKFDNPESIEKTAEAN